MIEQLKEYSIFNDVKPETLEEIVRAASPTETHTKNTALIEPRMKKQDVFFIASGTVRLSLISHDGDIVSYKDIHSKDLFGWLSVLDNKERLTSAITQEDTKIFTVKGHDFKRLLLADTKLMENFMVRVASVVRDYTQRIEELSVLSVTERIINECLRRKQNDSNIISIGTHEDFSSWLGIKRETVTRVLRKLEKQGALQKVESGYKILDL